MSSRRWLGRLGYALFLIAFVEISFQLFYRVTTGSALIRRAAQPIYAPEPHGGWMVQPNLTYRLATTEFATEMFTNSQGFRTSRLHEEFSKGRNHSRYRVMLLGPSFAFGWGVDYEQTFAAQLQEMLNHERFGGDRDVEIINAGVVALPPANNLNWFRHVGKDYAPDLVIQFVYGSMEVNPVAQASRVRDGYLLPVNPTLFQRAQAEAKKSAIVFYGWNIANQLSTRMGWSTPGRIEGAGRVMNVPQPLDVNAPNVAGAIRYYDDLRDTVEAAGARLLVVYFPLSYVIHPEDMGRWRHLGVQDVERQVAFDRDLADYLNQRGIACLNLTQHLASEATRRGRLYYWLDVHWTPAGNTAAAEATADWLVTSPERARR